MDTSYKDGACFKESRRGGGQGADGTMSVSSWPLTQNK